MAAGFSGAPLQDLIDVLAFQTVLDSFSLVTGLPTALLDPAGKVLAASKWQQICSEFHHPSSKKAPCLESDPPQAATLAEGPGYRMYRCRYGLVDVAIPVRVEGSHAASLFVGQFLLAPPDTNAFARQADALGFDRTIYLEALSKVPVLSLEPVLYAVVFLSNLAALISAMGLDRKRMAELSSRLERRNKEPKAEPGEDNERLRALSEASFEGILLSASGVIIEANERAAAMFGYRKAAELVGTRMTSLIAPEQRKEVESRMGSGYDKPYETVALSRSGNPFPAEIVGRTFRYQGRLVRGTAIRDLTEQREAQKEIQTLRSIVPICSFCKKIRDDQGAWEQVDTFLRKHAATDLSHSICPECMKVHYPAVGEPPAAKKK